MNCIFCKISNKEIPSYTIYEDDIVTAFLDVNPNHNGHTLIIPKKHYTSLEDIEESTLNHIMKISKKIYAILEKKLHPDGIKLVQNNGIAQEVKHYHLHIIPLYKNEEKMTLENVYEKITSK
mgnify:CR=1 FL=1